MKWIIRVTLPTGEVYAASAVDGMFAMTPVDKNGIFKNALGWDTKEEVVEWFQKFIDDIGPEQSKKVLDLNPEMIQCQTPN